MPIKELVLQYKGKMEKAAEFLAEELKAARTGRASTALVENLKVDYYGTPTALKQIAGLSAPQSDMIVIKPFDPGSSKEIEKAIKNSNLSLAPISDGKIIRLSIPPLSEERRRQIVSQIRQNGEQAKISVRNIRRDAIKHLEKEEDEGRISEDDLENGKKQIDEAAKQHTDKVEVMIKNKSDEIMRD